MENALREEASQQWYTECRQIVIYKIAIYQITQTQSNRA